MSKWPHIIGLAGTNGSGKDTVGQLLSTYHNYFFVSITDVLRAELKSRHVPITRENMRKLSAEWRHDYGVGILVDRAVEKYHSLGEQYNGVVIASLRNPGEADSVHTLGGIVLWVDADSKVRYERVQKNAATRDRQGEDGKSYEQFLAEEIIEMNPPLGSDSTALNMSAVKKLSDIQIDNNQQDQVHLQKAVEEALDLYSDS